MLVIAFDGILFDTLEFRANAVVQALTAEGIASSERQVLSILPSRSLAETIRAVAIMSPADETALDLATLRAERTIAELGSRGAVLNRAVRDRLRRTAAVTRIVVRADSRRREVEELLRLADLDSVVSLLRCSDDISEHRTDHAATRTGTDSPEDGAHGEAIHDQSNARPVRLTSVERSYAHIARRLYSNRTFLGTAANIGVALEVCENARAVARTHGFTTPESFDSANLPRS